MKIRPERLRRIRDHSRVIDIETNSLHQAGLGVDEQVVESPRHARTALVKGDAQDVVELVVLRQCCLAYRADVGAVCMNLPRQGNETCGQPNKKPGRHRHRPLFRPQLAIFPGNGGIPEWPVDIGITCRKVDCLERIKRHRSADHFRKEVKLQALRLGHRLHAAMSLCQLFGQ